MGRKRPRGRDVDIVFYESPTCVKCGVLREMLRNRGVRFKVRNIVLDAGAMRELAEQTGGVVTVPSLKIGARLLADPRWEDLAELLGINGKK